ncbi:uncharacterized protein BDV17DRAFT_112990 [Aspergillus undulatus]|uniref:uncharacterized protein n=1 Tax=Aspergillus undulatus TaxID=1810928 RepID=UPI003CCE0E89
MTAPYPCLVWFRFCFCSQFDIPDEASLHCNSGPPPWMAVLIYMFSHSSFFCYLRSLSIFVDLHIQIMVCSPTRVPTLPLFLSSPYLSF